MRLIRCIRYLKESYFVYVTYGAIRHAYLYNMTINKMTARAAPEGFDMAFIGEIFFCRFQKQKFDNYKICIFLGG